MKIRTLSLAATAAAAMFAALPAGAVAVQLQLQQQFFESTNDCAGYFGQGFNNCTVNGSPSIAKFSYSGEVGFQLSDKNTLYFPSIDGSEFSFDGMQWFYNPGANDPVIRYFTSKNRNDFTLFWYVNPSSECGTGIACAVGITSGAALPTGLSHVTFYDTGIPNVPEPATLGLLGLGLLGAGFARRRKA